MTNCAKGYGSMDMRKNKNAAAAAAPWSAPWRIGGLCLALTMGLGACDGLLDVEIPGDVPAEALDDPALASVLVLSAVGDFNCALTNYAGATAALTDEFIGAAGWIDYTDWDTRRITASDNDLGQGGCTNFGFGVYTPLQTSRVQAEGNFTRVQDFPDGDVADKPLSLATLAAYAGYSYTVLGEGFCELAFDEGPLATPAEAMSRAENWFGQAIQMAQQAGADDLLNMARVGQARVLLNQGRAAEAAGIAAMVPEGFVKYVERSGTAERRWNRIARHTHGDFYYSVDPTFRDLEFGGTPDPRVVTADAGRLGHDGITPIVLPMKYTDVSDPIALATWTEAQLIIAEAGGGQDAVDIINALHARAGLPSFASSDPAEIRNQIIEERSREFFLEGRRQADMLRYGIPFQTGFNHKGQPYGDTTCFPLPDVERINNPNIG